MKMIRLLVLSGTLLAVACAEQNLTGRQMHDRAVQESASVSAAATGPSVIDTQPGATELYGHKLGGKLLRMDRLSADKLFYISRGCIPKWIAESQDLLSPAVAAIKATGTGTRIIVFSHRDGDPIRRNGGELYDQRCGDKVREYLIQQGVAAERIQAFGMRDDFRIAPDTTVEGKRANRRIEIAVIAPDAH